MIKIEHTVFSAPFMLSAMLLSAEDSWPEWQTFFWAGVALFGARSSAMSLNRLIDAKFDKLNPRTANREIPSGQLKSKTVFLMSIMGFVVMLLAALNLPIICLKLLPIAIIWLSFYSYTKRFTFLCHLVLGIAIAGAVLGGWLAVSGSFHLVAFLLALAVCFWVMGFDILYALQDSSFDKGVQLHSIPVKFGHKAAINISKTSHLGSIVFFLLTGFFAHKLLSVSIIELIGLWIGLLIACLGLIYQQISLKKDLSNINKIFFNANAWVSSLFFMSLLLFKTMSHFF
ncbi:MAG TPA: 4-hydroxybenzoate octaprenyltransferase [Vampirovibrionales bacterium]